MRILVTGGSGLVGRYLQDILPDSNTFYMSTKDGDLTDIQLVRWMISSYTPDVIIHLAAKVGGIKDNISNPVGYFEDNILMNTNILKVSHEYKVKRFIGVLSTCIYPDKVENYPMKEEDMFLGPPTPTNFSYGYAKRSLAVQIDAYNQQYGTKYNYLIPCNLYGEFDNFENENKMHFITALLHKIRNAKDNKIELLGTGKPLRQFMYAKDFAEIIKLVIDNDITESFNVAPDYNYSIKKMAEIAINSINPLLKINFSNPELDGQYRKDVDNSKMRSLIPNFKFTPLEEGILRTYYNE
jgi:GDP-L-fucose synthase